MFALGSIFEWVRPGRSQYKVLHYRSDDRLVLPACLTTVQYMNTMLRFRADTKQRNSI
jgi:hypothetical protein